MTTADETARAAREHFVKWIAWYLEAFPDEAGSQEQLAARLGGVSAPAISMWRRKGSTRYPSMRNLIRFWALVNKVYRVHLDTLLFSDPPPLPKRQ